MTQQTASSSNVWRFTLSLGLVMIVVSVIALIVMYVTRGSSHSSTSVQIMDVLFVAYTLIVGAGMAGASMFGMARSKRALSS